jgi:hypothetical protein
MVFITEMKSAYCAVRTGIFYKRAYASSLKDFNPSGTFTVSSQYEILSLSCQNNFGNETFVQIGIQYLLIVRSLLCFVQMTPGYS